MKRLLFLAALLGIAASNSFAAHTKIYKGSYKGSHEEGSTCVVICEASQSYCYSVTTYAIQPNQNILNLQPDEVAEFTDTWSFPQGEIQNYATLQAYDENGDVVYQHSGYYGGMGTQVNQQTGEKIAVITLW
jgi:hypothetical protein